MAALIAGGGGVALLNSTTAEERYVLVGDTLQLIGVLLGVVFAAFALLITLFSDEYVRLLDKAKDGIGAFLSPFMIAVGVQVTTVFVTVAYRGSARDLNSKLEVALFLLWALLFAFSFLDVVALARNVSYHGEIRAEQIRRADNKEGSVRPLRDRTSGE